MLPHHCQISLAATPLGAACIPPLFVLPFAALFGLRYSPRIHSANERRIHWSDWQLLASGAQVLRRANQCSYRPQRTSRLPEVPPWKEGSRGRRGVLQRLWWLCHKLPLLHSCVVRPLPFVGQPLSVLVASYRELAT